MSVIRSSIKYVRFGSALSDIVIYSTGAPERAALFQILFTYYTLDFQYTSRNLPLQKYSDDYAVGWKYK